MGDTVVYRQRIEAGRAVPPSCWALLDDAERARAARFHRAHDRLRFVVGRAGLRQLLGEWLGAAPRTLAFEAGPWGKPQLAGAAWCHFNTSGGGDWVLHAVSDEAAVGVDVEPLPSSPWSVAGYAAVLTPGERHRLEQLPPDRQPTAFTALWVGKEAYTKALGEGLRRDFGHIELDASQPGRLRLVHDGNASPAPPAITLHPLAVDARHLGCLALAAAPGSAPRQITLAMLAQT